MTLPDLNDSEKLESDTGHQPSLSDTWDSHIKEVIFLVWWGGKMFKSEKLKTYFLSQKANL